MAQEFASLGSAVTLSTAGNGSAITVPDGPTVSVFIRTSFISGTPSVTFEAQWSMDGTNWYSTETPDTFTAITAGKSVVKSFTPKGRLMRLAWGTVTAGLSLTEAWACGVDQSVTLPG